MGNNYVKIAHNVENLKKKKKKLVPTEIFWVIILPKYVRFVIQGHWEYTRWC